MSHTPAQSDVSASSMLTSALCRGALLLFVVFALPVSAWAAPKQASKPLRIIFIDVEGGQATLFVTPQGESLLIDTGWPGFGGRDTQRIIEAAAKAGLSKINYVAVTHYHVDHAGGAPALAAAFPVGTFIDHGENRETTDPRTVETWKAYEKLVQPGKYERLIVKPGDVLPVKGMRAEIVSSDGAVIGGALPGAGQVNATCKDAEKYPADTTENLRSLGMMISFGKLRILDLGDLTRDKEMELMCPENRLGKVDIYIVSHHGWKESGSPALVHGITPRVAIMDNGAKKGGVPSVWDIIANTRGLEDFWQLHYSDEGGKVHNSAPELIANPEGPDGGHYLELTAHQDGSFEVFNSRTRRTKKYPSR